MKHYFFAGGGTGGHIYPAIAIAERITELQPGAQIKFFCSNRPIDSAILADSPFEPTILPAMAFSIRPPRFCSFLCSLIKSYRLAAKELSAVKEDAVVIGIGGFLSAPVVFAAAKLSIPVFMVNVDIVPGRANKLLARFAKEIFVQFDETPKHFGPNAPKVTVTGCPLRAAFMDPDKARTIAKLQLDENKKTILITGASSGSESINNAVLHLLPALEHFAPDWQIVHLAGRNNYQRIEAAYNDAKISHRVLGYWHDMANLYACADIIVGRAGAVSIAEFAASGKPTICLPYPYHRDKHQYRNAAALVTAGQAVIVDDHIGDSDKTSKELQKCLEELMADDQKRLSRTNVDTPLTKNDPALKIAKKIIQTT